MHWKLSEEQQAYQETLRAWLADVAAPATVRGWLDDGDVESFGKRLVADGMAGVGVAEELGGQGGGVIEQVLTAEELGRAAAPSGAWLATMVALPGLGQRPDLVGHALTGSPAALLAPADAVPAQAPRLQIDAQGRVSGEVPRVLAGDQAGYLVVATSEGEGVLRLVEVRGESVSVAPRRLLDRSRAVADVRLDGAPTTRLEVDGPAALDRATTLVGTLIAADALGVMQRMLDLAVDYSTQRHQFGVPIGSFQAVKHAAATMLVGIEAARSGVYLAAASVDADDPFAAMRAGAVKAQVTGEGVRAADSALTLHGAIGYTWEHDLQLWYKRARLDEHLHGAPAAWNERIAAALDLTGPA